MLQISSAANLLYKKLLGLTESKGLKKEGLFLLSGQQLVAEFLERPTLKVNSEIYCEGMNPSLPPKARIFLSKDLFKELDVLGTHSPILVVEQPSLKTWDPNSRIKGLSLLTPLGDPANLGALLRSAEAFQVEKVVLLAEAANPFLPKSVKASAGSVTRIPMEKGPSARDLSSIDGNWVGLDMKGRKLPDFQWPSNAFLLVGEEGAGLPELPKIQKISVPTQHVESLNATVAASIALYDYSLKAHL